MHGGTVNLLKSSPPQVLEEIVQDLVPSFRHVTLGHIAFSCVTPRPKDENTKGERVKQFNTALIQWCKENGCVCRRTVGPFLKSGRAKRSLFKEDLLHPRPKGKPMTGDRSVCMR